MKQNSSVHNPFHQTIYQERRNQKSIKVLNLHLKQYSLSREKDLQMKYQSQNISKQLKADPRLIFDPKYDEKCASLIDNIILNISIFRKVFSSSKKKRQIIEKLYGWDEAFQTIFFDENEMKKNLKREEIIRDLHLDKKTFNSKNTYNKLRFFLTELIDTNKKQQQMQSHFQRIRLSESSNKLLERLQRYSEQSKKKENKKHLQKMRTTHLELVNMKMRIKNKGEDLKKIVESTGRVKMNPFFLNEEKNVHFIESFAKESLIK